MDHSGKRRVAYYYEPEIGNYYYGHGHPMKPHRVRMAHTLIVRYGLYRYLEVFKPVRASEKAMSTFHAPDYIDFLKNVSGQGGRAGQVWLASDAVVEQSLWHRCLV